MQSLIAPDSRVKSAGQAKFILFKRLASNTFDTKRIKLDEPALRVIVLGQTTDVVGEMVCAGAGPTGRAAAMKGLDLEDHNLDEIHWCNGLANMFTSRKTPKMFTSRKTPNMLTFGSTPYVFTSSPRTTNPRVVAMVRCIVMRAKEYHQAERDSKPETDWD
jgi:hypothetical protein